MCQPSSMVSYEAIHAYVLRGMHICLEHVLSCSGIEIVALVELALISVAACTTHVTSHITDPTVNNHKDIKSTLGLHYTTTSMWHFNCQRNEWK